MSENKNSKLRGTDGSELFDFIEPVNDAFAGFDMVSSGINRQGDTDSQSLVSESLFGSLPSTPHSNQKILNPADIFPEDVLLWLLQQDQRELQARGVEGVYYMAKGELLKEQAFTIQNLENIGGGVPALTVHCGNPFCIHPLHVFHFGSSVVLQSEDGHKIFVETDELDSLIDRLTATRDLINGRTAEMDWKEIRDENFHVKVARHHGMLEEREGKVEVLRYAIDHPSSDQLEASVSDELSHLKSELMLMDKVQDFINTQLPEGVQKVV